MSGLETSKSQIIKISDSVFSKFLQIIHIPSPAGLRPNLQNEGAFDTFMRPSFFLDSAICLKQPYWAWISALGFQNEAGEV